MRRIRVLDEVLSNQIAAGEVVERPASVVKELIENAVDAGATAITVELSGGGVERLRVVDNGHGMSREDAVLALQRHATSKLATVEDLENIQTLGFRGEAIPSIASVSKMKIRTREPDALGAIAVRVEGGKVVDVREAAGPVGTEFVIEDLFFNVPARRKFLKKLETEASHVQEAVQRLALCYPQVAVRLVKEGRVSLDLPVASDLRERVSGLFGNKVARGLVDVCVQGAFGMDGLIGPPDQAKGTARHYHVFINGRYVRDRVIISAVQSGYGSSLDRGRHPFVVLRLNLPPQAVDVNVHPAKTEVRFVDSSAVHRLVGRALDARIRDNPWASVADESSKAEAEQTAVSKPYRLEAGHTEDAGVAAHRRRIFDAMERLTTKRTGIIGSRGGLGGNGSSAAGRFDRAPSPGMSPTAGSPGTAVQAPTPTPMQAQDSMGGPPEVSAVCIADHAEVRALPFSQLVILGRHDDLLVCKASDGVVLIAVEAAWWAVYYDRVMRAGSSQTLGRPVTLELGAAEAEQFRAASAVLDEVGFEIEPFGGSSFVVKRIPQMVPRDAVAMLLRELLAEPGQADRTYRSWVAWRCARRGEQPGRGIRDEELLNALAGIEHRSTEAEAWLGILPDAELLRMLR